MYDSKSMRLFDKSKVYTVQSFNKACDNYEQAPKIFLSQKIKLFNFGNHAKRVKFNNEAFWKLAQYMIVLIDSILFFASLKNISLK